MRFFYKRYRNTFSRVEGTSSTTGKQNKNMQVGYDLYTVSKRLSRVCKDWLLQQLQKITAQLARKRYKPSKQSDGSASLDPPK